LKKYISSFISGFGAGVLQIVPVAKNFACCLIIPAATYIAVLLDRKAKRDEQKISVKKGLMIGLVTGLYAALFGSLFELIITFITHNNDFIFAMSEFQKVIKDLPFDDKIKSDIFSMLSKAASDIQTKGFSVLYTFSIITNNFIINPLFGLLGGLISVQIINSNISKDTPEF
jgi:hypothetical protein